MNGGSMSLRCVMLVVAMTPLACLQKLDLNIPRMERQSLHVEAKLIRGEPSVISVEINTIFDLTPGSFAPVDVRSVHLLDEFGSRLEIPRVGSGTYYLALEENGPIQVRIGDSYAMEILTQRDELIISAMDKLYALGDPSELTAYRFERDFKDRFDEFIKQPFIGFDLNVKILQSSQTNRGEHFRFEVERTYRVTDNLDQVCYVSQFFNLDNEITLTTSNLREDRDLILPVIGVFISSFHAEGYYLNLHQQSLSPRAYQYWHSIQQVLNRNGNMFEAPAGKIRSNFQYQDDPKREIFGIFYATDTTIFRKYISPEFADFPLQRCPPPPPGNLDVCNDCLSLPRSQLDKPTFWVE